MPDSEPAAADSGQQPEEEPQSLEHQLFVVAAAGDAAAVARLLSEGAEPACETDEGVTPLMAAASSGSEAALRALLEAGAPWHAQDAGGRTAGEYASGGGHRACVRALLDWAVRAELLLGSIARRERKGAAPNRDYLSSSIKYIDGRLMDEQGALQGSCAGAAPGGASWGRPLAWVLTGRHSSRQQAAGMSLAGPTHSSGPHLAGPATGPSIVARPTKQARR